MRNKSDFFRNSIRNGTGEAIVLLKKNPSIDFDEYILDACTHNLAYDPQCEGSRADYLFEILSFAKNREKIIDEILMNLSSSNKEYWDVHLLFDLALLLAKEGNGLARKVIYKRYANNLSEDFECIDTDVLVKLDGLNGLEFVADIQGKQLDKDSNFWIDEWLLDICKEYFPKTSPKNYLIEKSHNNKYIELFLSEMEEFESKEDDSKKKSKLSLLELLDTVKRGENIPIISGKWLNEEELLNLVQILQKEEDEWKIQSYLRILKFAKYPLDISTLLPFLKVKNEQIKRSTLNILSKVKDEKIRELIDSNYSNLDFLFEHLRLFESNFLEKDMEVLFRIFNRLKDEDEIHFFGLVICAIARENTIENPKRLIEELYYVNNCSICRESFIKILMSTNQLSDKIYEELKYDCDSSIRQLSDVSFY